MRARAVCIAGIARRISSISPEYKTGLPDEEFIAEQPERGGTVEAAWQNRERLVLAAREACSSAAVLTQPTG